MIGIAQAFSGAYAQARRRFLEAAATAGARITTHEHPLRGTQGETLALDCARLGADNARRVLLVSSGCHGVEGYCGSGVQVWALHDAEFLTFARGHGVALVMLHALNPWGFAFDRRVTHEGVDLNRNFLDFSAPLPANPGYDALHAVLLPRHWPPTADNEAAIARYVADHGMAAFQAAVSAGQSSHAQGLFYSGRAPCWSHVQLRQALRQHGAGAARIGWIDIHTGLGPQGHGERIWAGADDRTGIERAQRWWGAEGRTPITSIYDGSSSSARLQGMMWTAVAQECPQAEYTGMALEFGTEPLERVILALRGDHWLACNPQAPDELALAIRTQMRQAFYIDRADWQAQVISQARQALFQAVQGLSAPN